MPLFEPYRVLARYNRWMNEWLYAIADTLTEEERRRELGAFFRSVHGTLNHILLADRIWLARFTGDRTQGESRDATGSTIPLTGRLDQELYADFTLLRKERAATDAAIDTWVDGLDDARLEGPLAYRARGRAFEHPLWWAVTHFFNHQTHHRGQLTTLLHQLGRDPGVTDLIVFLRA